MLARSRYVYSGIDVVLVMVRRLSGLPVKDLSVFLSVLLSVKWYESGERLLESSVRGSGKGMYPSAGGR